MDPGLYSLKMPVNLYQYHGTVWLFNIRSTANISKVNNFITSNFRNNTNIAYSLISINKIFLFLSNKNMFKTMKVPLNTYFYNLPSSVPRQIFFAIYIPFSRSPNIGEIKDKQKAIKYFSYFISSCTNTIAVFNNLFALICRQPREKQKRTLDFPLFKYFLNNLLLTVSM